MADTTDTRPKWPFTIAEKTARWLAAHSVEGIVKRRKIGSDWTAESWIELQCIRDDKVVETLKVSEYFLQCDYVKMPNSNYRKVEVIFDTSTHRGLVQLDKSVADHITAVDAWDKRNQKDRVEFERLKRKFGGAA